MYMCESNTQMLWNNLDLFLLLQSLLNLGSASYTLRTESERRPRWWWRTRGRSCFLCGSALPRSTTSRSLTCCSHCPKRKTLEGQSLNSVMTETGVHISKVRNLFKALTHSTVNCVWISLLCFKVLISLVYF